MVLTSATLAVWLATVAQAGAPGGGGSFTSGWFAAGGLESQSLRDISRGGPPVDASPIEWRGSGPFVSIGYERPGPRRFHRAALDVSAARSFAYAGPIRRVDASGEDRLLRVEGRYEYRRYPFDDLFVRGFDAGVGIQGIGRRVTYTRVASTFGTQRNGEVTAGVACVAAARLRRWSRWSADVEWVNGIGASRAREAFDVDPLAVQRRWGGGWLTDLSARVTVRATPRLAVSVAYLQTGEGTMVTNNAYATSRRRVAVGVVYAR